MAAPHPLIWYDIDRKEFDRKLRKLLARSDDLSPAFHTVGKMFRQSRKTIFRLKSPGGYKDLSPQYKNWKTKAKYVVRGRGRRKVVANPYPILKLTGDLEKSVTRVGHRHNVNIVNKKSFAFGTNLPYAKFHNSAKKPRNKIPLRMFIFWGPEAPATMRNRTDATRKFGNRAIKVIKNFLIRDGK